MKENFESALATTLRYEGSEFTDDPDDRGGATQYGVIQERYNQYRKAIGLAQQSVRYITMPEVKAIYRKYYWNAVAGDSLPAVLDTVVFDAGVNHGPARAAKWLQTLVGATPDGQIGAKTVALVAAKCPDVAAAKKLAQAFCDRREQFYEDIAVGNQRKWLKGWMNRLQDLRKLFGLRDGDGPG